MNRTGPKLLVCAGLLLASTAAGADRVDARIFAGRSAADSASFLVVLRETADLSGSESLPTREEKTRFVFEALREHAEATQGPLRARLAAAGVPFRPFFLVNMIEVEGDRDLAAELAARPDVHAVAPNLPARLRPARDAGDVSPSAHGSRVVEPNLTLIRAPDLWSRGFTGQEIVVAVADTGLVWEHPALRQRYRGLEGGTVSHDYNWHDAIHVAGPGNPCGVDAAAPCDDSGHGTSVAGLAVGGDGVNEIGVAPGARLIGCRNMASGVGTPATYTECFQFFIAPTDRAGGNPRPDLAPHVINNSWGCPPEEGCTDPNVLRAVVENTRAAGIAVVMAAGNTGSGCGTVRDPPAIYEASFSVGASNLADGIASFSARGPVTVDGSGRLKPDIVAPGVGVRTAAGTTGYGTFTGTSAAAPHVSGAMALLLSAVPGLRGAPRALEEVLRRSAVRLTASQDCGGSPGAAVPNPVFGWGRLDVLSAYTLAAPFERQTPRAASRPVAPRLVPLRQ